MFGENKAPNEYGYKKEVHQTLTDSNICEENLEVVAEIMHNKIINE